MIQDANGEVPEELIIHGLFDRYGEPQLNYENGYLRSANWRKHNGWNVTVYFTGCYTTFQEVLDAELHENDYTAELQ